MIKNWSPMIWRNWGLINASSIKALSKVNTRDQKLLISSISRVKNTTVPIAKESIRTIIAFSSSMVMTILLKRPSKKSNVISSLRLKKHSNWSNNRNDYQIYCFEPSWDYCLWISSIFFYAYSFWAWIWSILFLCI